MSQIQIISEQSLIDDAKRIGGAIILPDEENTPHLSPSSIKTLKDCEVKYCFRYVEGLKVPPSSALAVGRGYDNATTTDYEHKIKTGENLSVEDTVDCFTTSFDQEIDDTELALGESKDELRDMGVKLVKEFSKSLAGSVDPMEVQKRYRIKFPGDLGWDLVVVLDVVEKNNTIRDNKTTKRTPGKVDMDYWFQMLCYAVAEKMTKPEEETAGRVLKLDYAVKLKTPKIITLDVREPDDNDFRFFQNYTAAAFDRMIKLKKGVDKPIMNRSSMLCSRKYCGYWAMCEQKYGGRVDD